MAEEKSLVKHSLTDTIYTELLRQINHLYLSTTV